MMSFFDIVQNFILFKSQYTHQQYNLYILEIIGYVID